MGKMDASRRVGGAQSRPAAPAMQQEKSKIDGLRDRIPFQTSQEKGAKKHQYSKKLPPAEAKVSDRLAGPLKRVLPRAA